ncbi:MAG: hypothetical protein ACRDBL_11445 [Rhabdaerophilum sp.]
MSGPTKQTLLGVAGEPHSLRLRKKGFDSFSANPNFKKQSDTQKKGIIALL